MKSSVELLEIDSSLQTKCKIFHPGSEWMYLKLYTGVKMQEIIITEYLPSLIMNSAIEFDCWFFVRYLDPEPHLRIRIKADINLQASILIRIKEILQPLLESKVIWKYHLDSYAPEYDRYGGLTRISLAEKLFEINSKLAISTLKKDWPYEWVPAILAIDVLIKSAFKDIDQKILFLKILKDSFFAEHGSMTAIRKEINNQYRNHRKQLIPILNNYTKNEFWQEQVDSTNIILDQYLNGLKTEEVMNYVSSIIHMSCNRFLRSQQRTYELVLYDFLYQYYFTVKVINFKSI